MTAPESYEFNKVTRADLALLEAWQSATHVRDWWDADDPYTEAELADPRVKRWLVSRGGQRFAFMQGYAVHGWDSHHFSKPTQRISGN